MVRATVVMPAIRKSMVRISMTSISTVELFAFETFVFEAAMVEISYILSFKIGTIVFIVEPVPKVPVPGRVIIVRIAGKLGCIICVVVNHGGGGGINDGSGINTYARNAQAYMSADIYLGVAFTGDEAGGDDGRKDK